MYVSACVCIFIYMVVCIARARTQARRAIPGLSRLPAPPVALPAPDPFPALSSPLGPAPAPARRPAVATNSVYLNGVSPVPVYPSVGLNIVELDGNKVIDVVSWGS